MGREEHVASVVRRFTAAAIVAGGLAGSPAGAQVPDAPQVLYSDVCFVLATGGTKGQALQIVKSQGA